MKLLHWLICYFVSVYQCLVFIRISFVPLNWQTFYFVFRFIFAISRSLPLFLILAWVLTVAMICKNIVYEKEMRLKEVMKIMGLNNGVHWLAWFIDAFVVMFVSLILLIIILKVGCYFNIVIGYVQWILMYNMQSFQKFLTFLISCVW